MRWINYFKYEWFKRQSKKWFWMSLGSTAVWILILFYFSHLWQNPLERALDEVYLKAYYQEQSSYLAYLVIGFTMMRYSMDWMGEKYAYLEVMFGAKYLFFKFLLFFVETLWIVTWHFLWIQLFYIMAFQKLVFLWEIGSKLLINACVFSGFVVLWNRIKPNLSMVFSLVFLVLHPNLNNIPIGWIDFNLLFPFMTHKFPLHGIGIVCLYYWFGFQLSLMKSK